MATLTEAQLEYLESAITDGDDEFLDSLRFLFNANTYTGDIRSEKLQILTRLEQILFGDVTDPETGIGIFIGRSGDNYEFRIGDPNGDFLKWDGTILTIASGTVAESMTQRIFMQGNPDRLNDSSSIGIVTINYATTRLKTNNNNSASLDSDDFINQSKDYTFSFILKFVKSNADTAHLFYGINDGNTVGPTSDGAFTTHHAGVVIGTSGGVQKYWVSSGDGVQERTDISGITTFVSNVSVNIVKTSSNVKFYFDGVLVATHSTRIPSDTSSNIFIYISESTPVNAFLDTYNNFTFTQSLT